MRIAADILLPVLAEGEPSKAPFYIAGGVLAAWAVVLSAIGLSRPEFPGGAGAARAVMGVSAVLVLATIAAAISTATKHHAEKGEAQAQEREPAGEPAAPAPEQPAPSGSGGATVSISADPTGQLAYEEKSVTARPGRITIEFDNPSPVSHDVTVERGGKDVGATKVVTDAKASTTVTLQPGAYTFYCSVDAHRQAGMEGTLTVS